MRFGFVDGSLYAPILLGVHSDRSEFPFRPGHCDYGQSNKQQPTGNQPLDRSIVLIRVPSDMASIQSGQKGVTMHNSPVIEAVPTSTQNRRRKFFFTSTSIAISGLRESNDLL